MLRQIMQFECKLALSGESLHGCIRRHAAKHRDTRATMYIIHKLSPLEEEDVRK